MAKTIKEYRRLDFSKLNFADEPISTKEALKDTVPLPLPQEVIDGKKQMNIDVKGIHYV